MQYLCFSTEKSMVPSFSSVSIGCLILALMEALVNGMDFWMLKYSILLFSGIDPVFIFKLRIIDHFYDSEIFLSLIFWLIIPTVLKTFMSYWKQKQVKSPEEKSVRQRIQFWKRHRETAMATTRAKKYKKDED